MKTVNEERPCKGYEERLTLYHYGELGPEETAETAAHLSSCGACRAYLEGLAATLGALPVFSPGRSETRKAVEGVKERLSRGKRPPAWRLVPALAAAAALVLVVLFAMHRQQPATNGLPAGPAVMAQADIDAMENLDLLKDLDAIEDMDVVEGVENL